MPRVPTYDGPQLAEAPLPGPYQQQVDVSRNERQLAAGLAGLSDVLDKRQQRMDQDAAFAAEAQLKTEWLDFEGKLRAQRKGRDAATYDADVEQWWKDAAQRYGKDLTPNARRLVSRSLTTSQVQAVAGAKAYKEQQLNASAEASYRAAQAVSINEAATVGNEAAVEKALADMAQKRAERAQAQGWTPEQTKADELTWSSTLHSVVVQKMMRADPAAAQVYYDKHKASFTAETQAQIEAGLAQTSAALDANNAATEIWAAIGPKRDGQPVELDKLEAAARDRFKNDPTRLRNTIAELQQRAAGFNAAEQERRAANTNAVMDAYSRGTPLARLQTMPEFQALPGAERAKIVEHINDRNHMLWARSIEDRARIEREAQRRAFPAFLEYSNPDNLATMTRQQVQALLPSLGSQLTEHLVQKWDTLQTANAKIEAKMDAEDFNHIANQMGLAPFRANTEDKKRELGELKFRVEQLIDSAQQAKKAPLTRQEKMTLMQTEMARTVTVNPLFGFERQVPVIQLSPDQLRNVVVPEADRGQIAAALKTMYDRTGSPLYAPTEENMRRLYLLNKSRAAAMLPAEK